MVNAHVYVGAARSNNAGHMVVRSYQIRAFPQHMQFYATIILSGSNFYMYMSLLHGAIMQNVTNNGVGEA